MLQRNSKIRTRKGFCRKLFIFNISPMKSIDTTIAVAQESEGWHQKKTPEQACSAVSVVAVLRPSGEDSLSETPQYIEHNQLHSIINLCSLLAAWIAHQSPLLLTHIASHSLVGMQDLSDLLEVQTFFLFKRCHFGEAFFSSAYPISYRLFFVPGIREVSWWKGKEFRQEVHS